MIFGGVGYLVGLIHQEHLLPNPSWWAAFLADTGRKITMSTRRFWARFGAVIRCHGTIPVPAAENWVGANRIAQEILYYRSSTSGG